MVEIIGLGTMGALVGLIARSMGGESESEKRRIATSRESGRSAEPAGSDRQTRHATYSYASPTLTCKRVTK